eukprot:m.184387 g.184387  ORF g.184387 m.184387 type:complete len:81 (-) comp16906_c0_seq2:40-282(-)
MKSACFCLCNGAAGVGILLPAVAAARRALFLYRADVLCFGGKPNSSWSAIASLMGSLTAHTRLTLCQVSSGHLFFLLFNG